MSIRDFLAFFLLLFRLIGNFLAILVGLLWQKIWQKSQGQSLLPHFLSLLLVVTVLFNLFLIEKKSQALVVVEQIPSMTTDAVFQKTEQHFLLNAGDTKQLFQTYQRIIAEKNIQSYLLYYNASLLAYASGDLLSFEEYQKAAFEILPQTTP